MLVNQTSGGKNRQQKREKQKSKKSKSSKYTQKHIRVQQAMSERRQQLGNKHIHKNQNPSQNNTKNKKNNKKKQKGGSNKPESCGPGSTFNPKECCLPGIPCHYPCYQQDYDDEVNRCVNHEGKSANLREILELTKCNRGVYNPEECCDSTDYGPTCVAPCYDGENCYNMSGETPFQKIYKKERAKKLIQKLADQEAGAYEKIYNPQTGRWVKSKGVQGKNILKQYLSRFKFQ